MSFDYEKVRRSQACPCCGAKDFKHWMEASDQTRRAIKFQLRRCDSCGHVWLGDPPSPEQLGYYYSPEYHQAIGQSGQNDPDRWGKQLRVISKFKTQGSVLDIGCSAGGFLSYLKGGPWKLNGIEASAETAEKARRATGGDILAGDVMDAEFAPESFDVITCSDVMEHLYEPRAVFQRVYEWLKPGGIFYLFVPNIMSWEARVFGTRWWGLDLPRHLHHYSIDSLEALAKCANLPLMRLVTPAGCYIEQSASMVLNDMLHAMGARNANVNLGGPAWFGWRSVRKVIRLTAVAAYAQTASYFKAAPSLQAVFQQAERALPQMTEGLSLTDVTTKDDSLAFEKQEVAQ